MNTQAYEPLRTSGRLETIRDIEKSCAADTGCGARPVNVGRMERYVSMGLGAALGLAGLSRGRLPGLLLAAVGGGMLYRGVTGHCYTYAALGLDTAEHPDATVVPAQQGEHVEKAIAINRSPSELFNFWRDVSNLPQVMRHIKHVEVESPQRSLWTAEGPFGRELLWEAEIFNERQDELIAWRSLPGGDIETAGSVRFKPLGQDRGTEVRITLKYNPPAGKVGAMIATASGRGLKQEITEDLRNLKQKFETGEIPTAAMAEPMPEAVEHAV
jgi:uncharacterized membrane protein